MSGKKSVLLAGVLLLATFAAFAAGQGEAEAETAEPIVLRAGLIDPPNHVDVTATEMFADIVAERTNGGLEIQVYPASQLGFAAEMLEGMTLGTVDMFVGATTWLGAFEVDYWISGVLYMFNDQEHAREIHRGEAFAQLAEVLREEHGIRVLAQEWDRGPRNFIATEPIESPADLEGLRIRVPPQVSWVNNFELAGASPTPLPLVETFTGLQQGVVTATEQASNWLYFNDYHTIANYLTRSNHNYEETGVMISEEVFQSLPADYQQILVDAIEEVTEFRNEQVLVEIEEAEAMMADEGITIIDVDTQAWKEHFRAGIDELVEIVGYTPEFVEAITSTWD